MTNPSLIPGADPSRVQVTGPLAPFATSFASELSQQGYTASSACALLRLMAHLSHWLAAEQRGAGDLSPAEAERFLEARRAAGYTNHLSAKALAPLLAHLRVIGVAPPPPAALRSAGAVEELLHRYRRYLTIERGLGTRTARDYTNAVRPFLSERHCPEGLDLSGLGSADVSAFVLSVCRRQSRASASHTLSALRSLLSFLHYEGAISRPLMTAVPSLANWQLASLPKGLELGEVEMLLGSCDRTTATGRRDFAILTLLSRMGLRAGEVAELLLDDIDWQAGELLVRGKGRRCERLPLPTDVGGAIAAYLRSGRPAGAEGRTVFVRALAPRRVLGRGGVTRVVAAAAERAGLGQIHAHRLRHTAATEALRGGASLPEVGQLLRHQRAQTTAVYAKVNREALREIAHPWPGGPR